MNELKNSMDEKHDGNLRHRGGNDKECGKSKSQINAEYFQALEQWLSDVRTYRYSCSFFMGLPYTIFSQQMSGLPASQSNSAYNFLPFIYSLNQQQQLPQQQQIQRQGVEYTVPPLWKRLMAELVDFGLLFLIKMAITLVALDFFEIVVFDKIETLQRDSKVDYKIAMEITYEVLFLEALHRLIVCLYEGLYLSKGTHNQIGGATPGKRFMGLRVVLCNIVFEVENQPNVVKVFSGTNLGLGWSFARAFLKNLVLPVLFPICFPFFCNKFNRTTYDILCHSIVVEDRGHLNRNR